jgi:hypothetical protein
LETWIAPNNNVKIKRSPTNLRGAMDCKRATLLRMSFRAKSKNL